MVVFLVILIQNIEHRMHILILSEDIKVFIFCILNSVWVQTLL